MPSYQSPLGRPEFRRPQLPIQAPHLPNFVVERRVTRSTDAVVDIVREHATGAVAKQFRLGSHGTLLVDAAPRHVPFPTCPAWPMWQANASMFDSRNRLVSRVCIEIVIGLPDAVLIQLRPVHRHPHRWSARRTDRHFALAHAAADRLAQLLSSDGATAARDWQAHSAVSRTRSLRSR